MDTKQLTHYAYKYAIKNAFEYNGKASPKAVAGKIKTLFPDIDLKTTPPEINKAIAKVNKLSNNKIEKEYTLFSEKGWELKQTEKEKTLPEFCEFGISNPIITRLAPCPTGVMHLGHARPAILTNEYVKKYGGKLILRFDDTDPKIKYPEAGMEDEFIKDLTWLKIFPDKIFRQSDRLKKYYAIIEKLIIENKAYICTCKNEDWKKKMIANIPCPCRTKPETENLKLWKKMLTNKIKEGKAIVRFKTNLKIKDPTFRDWWIAKIVDNIKHTNPNVLNTHVWPSYNLASAIDDHDFNINFIIRGQEHRPNEIKQRALYKYFGWNYPKTAYHGKILCLGNIILSKSKMKKLMENYEILDYDDPRLATIKSLRRKGICPKTIKQLILKSGLKINSTRITEELISEYNKKNMTSVIDATFLQDAKMITLNNHDSKFNIYIENNNYHQLINLKQLGKYCLEPNNEYVQTQDDSKLPVTMWIKDPKEITLLQENNTLIKGFIEKNLLNHKYIKINKRGYYFKDKIAQQYIYSHK